MLNNSEIKNHKNQLDDHESKTKKNYEKFISIALVTKNQKGEIM